ncbi:MAG: putative sensor hybrid histidine kinase [Bryobacterales bacterium]|nr:putative sensor hybrid histidine kinase [Bryobacterales bacterium]
MRDADGKIIRWFGAATDIDDRKRAEEKLRVSEEKFRALIENSSDGFALVDGNGVVLYLGRPILGYETNERLGARLTDLVHPDDREDLKEKLQAVINNPGRGITAQYRARHKDGSWRWVEGVAKNLLDNPSVQAIVVNYRDITERRRIEEQLLQTQKLESLGLLAGGIAHDFNNLLTGIMGNASMVIEALPRDNPNRSSLLDVVNASARAADLTHQMLAFAGKGRFVTQFIDLSELVREISHLIERAVPKNIQIRLSLDANLPAIEVDPSQMQQLIMNLVINGAEALEENENGTVMVITGAQEVDTNYLDSLSMKGELEPGNYVFLEVVDTGKGMDEETKAKIFDPFFTTKFMGRGLGLAATLGIVRGHKGSIKIYSTPGQGTTFKVLIPAAAEKAATRRPESQKDLRGFGAVLVVDDEEIVRKTAATALERYGYEVLQAENGPVAIDLLHAHGDRVSMVLLDMTMPLMSGEEVFRRLKAISPRVPIIVSSGYNETEAIRRFTGRGIAGFIQKPYTAAQLAEKIKGVLEQRESAVPPA